MKKRGTAGLLGGALAVVLLAGNVLGGSYPAAAGGARQRAVCGEREL